MSKVLWSVAFAITLTFAGAARVRAQATSNPVASAEDAFGSSEGAESVGIYDQSSVRGFSLEAAGNYRINGRYFAKNSGVSSFFLERTIVRIGYNALSLDHPGSSGVVDYKLRDPQLNEPSQLTVGRDVFEQPFAELHFKHRDRADAYSASIGASSRFRSADEQGSEGQDALLAGAVRIGPPGGARFQAFGGEYRYRRNGRFRIVLAPEAASPPPEIARGRYLGQSWATEHGARRIVGALGDMDFDEGWSARAIGVVSQEDPADKFAQLFSLIDENGRARSSVIVSPAQRSTSYSSELRVGRIFRTGALTHSTAINARWRETHARFGGERFVTVGETVLGRSAQRIEFADPKELQATLRDHISQRGFGIAHQSALQNRFRMNAGVLYSTYSKQFTDDARKAMSNESAKWLHNIGAVLTLTDGLELYGSYSRALEEAGTAPAVATNANAVLEAAIAAQREVGLRLGLDADLTLFVAGFDVRKPNVGIDAATGAFGYIGDVTHRGLETSLSGALSSRLTAAIGAVYMEPRVSGARVDLGLVGERPVGVPEWRAVANVDYRITSRLSLDLGLEYIGEHAARSRLSAKAGAQLSLPASTVLDIGARYHIDAFLTPITVRAQLTNALNDFSWRTAPGETIDYSPERSLRVLLTAEF